VTAALGSIKASVGNSAATARVPQTMKVFGHWSYFTIYQEALVDATCRED
jgi:hypothetical protein